MKFIDKLITKFVDFISVIFKVEEQEVKKDVVAKESMNTIKEDIIVDTKVQSKLKVKRFYCNNGHKNFLVKVGDPVPHGCVHGRIKKEHK